MVKRSYLLLCLCAASLVEAQTIRDHTREGVRDTSVSESQAVDLKLTVAPVAMQSIQTWVRTAGRLDEAGKTLTACVTSPDAGLVRVGQRVRSFSPESKSSIYQARVTAVASRDDCVAVEATLSGTIRENAFHYVMEIIVERGTFLVVPNDAIIEEQGRQVVYLQHDVGAYIPQEIHTGVKGELYTEVLHGVSQGDEIAVLGSFFVDADYKLKDTEQDATSNAHQHH